MIKAIHPIIHSLSPQMLLEFLIRAGSAAGTGDSCRASHRTHPLSGRAAPGQGDDDTEGSAIRRWGQHTPGGDPESAKARTSTGSSGAASRPGGWRPGKCGPREGGRAARRGQRRALQGPHGGPSKESGRGFLFSAAAGAQQREPSGGEEPRPGERHSPV